MKAEEDNPTHAIYRWTALDAIALPVIFLSRIRHCAGYGVQSPTDYAFVREVIYEPQKPQHPKSRISATIAAHHHRRHKKRG